MKNDDEKIYHVFSKNKLFDSLSNEDFQSLLSIMSVKQFKEGEDIVVEGGSPDKVYLIVSGSTSVLKKMSDNNEIFEHEIAVLHPGDSIGDITLIDKQPRSATVRALEPTETLSFSVDDLASLTKHDDSIEAKLKINFARRMSEYLRNANNNTLSERKKHQSEITTLTNFDFVTGLPNQYLFKEKLTERLVNFPGESIALIQIEIVDFKEVCDALGNNVGEEFLTAISDRLGAALLDTGLMARVGYNQFMILYTNMSDLAAVQSLLTRLTHLFASPFMIGDDNIFTNIYIGVAHYPDDGLSPDLLIKHAGLALDSSKLNGPNSHAFYDQNMELLVEQRRKLIHELHEAFQTDQFELYYQPQIRLSDNKLVGAEALIRWIHPVEGMISPAVFIPIIEQTGLILKLGVWIFNMACSQAKMWRDAGTPIRVAVNLSALQFMQKDLVAIFSDIIREMEMDASLIELEMTESIMMSDTQEVLKKINQFVDLGFILAIDDFGTGYSSLSSLSKLPIHKLKIDQSFVNNLSTSDESKAIVRCIIGLAKGLGMELIAEGVEHQEQVDFLRSLDCDEGQGYLFSKPIPPDEFESLYFSKKEGL